MICPPVGLQRAPTAGSPWLLGGLALMFLLGGSALPVHAQPGDDYAGMVNNADLYIDYCSTGIPGRRQCVERRAQAWGQVCTQENADRAGFGGLVDGAVPEGYVYTAWHCIMQDPRDKLLDGGTSGVPSRPVS